MRPSRRGSDLPARQTPALQPVWCRRAQHLRDRARYGGTRAHKTQGVAMTKNRTGPSAPKGGKHKGRVTLPAATVCPPPLDVRKALACFGSIDVVADEFREMVAEQA